MIARRDIPGWGSMTMIAAVPPIKDRFTIEFRGSGFALLASVDDVGALIEMAFVEVTGG